MHFVSSKFGSISFIISKVILTTFGLILQILSGMHFVLSKLDPSSIILGVGQIGFFFCLLVGFYHKFHGSKTHSPESNGTIVSVLEIIIT